VDDPSEHVHILVALPQLRIEEIGRLAFDTTLFDRLGVVVLKISSAYATVPFKIV
jgi:hypothetical protein